MLSRGAEDHDELRLFALLLELIDFMYFKRQVMKQICEGSYKYSISQ